MPLLGKLFYFGDLFDLGKFFCGLGSERIFGSRECYVATASAQASGAAAIVDEVTFRIFVEIEKVIGDFFELSRSRAAERNDLDLAARVHSEEFDERNEIAVAGEKNDSV